MALDDFVKPYTLKTTVTVEMDVDFNTTERGQVTFNEADLSMTVIGSRSRVDSVLASESLQQALMKSVIRAALEALDAGKFKSSPATVKKIVN